MTEQHAAIISAVSAAINTLIVLGSFALVIWKTCFRKTEPERLDELKRELKKWLDNNEGGEIYPRQVRPMLASLDPKFQEKEYKELHVSAYHELRREGVIKHKFHVSTTT